MAFAGKTFPDTAGYVSRIGSIGNALIESEIIDAEAERLERIALGLRTTEGIPLSLLGPDGLLRAKTLAEEDLARISNGRIVLIHRGRALVDPIAAELV